METTPESAPMPELPEIPPPPKRRRPILRLLALVLLLPVVLAVAALAYLATPGAARKAATLLSGMLHLPVTIAAIEPRPGGLLVHDLSLGNPAGFPAGTMAHADTIGIYPRWLELLRGRPAFRLIELVGVRVELAKDREGRWNWSALQGEKKKEKRPPPEIRIGEFALEGGEVRIEGHEVRNLFLRLRDISTVGSIDSRLEFSAADPWGSRFRLTGSVRPGSQPAVDLLLAAPEIDAARYAPLLRGKGKAFLAGGKGSLSLAIKSDRQRIGAVLDISVRGLVPEMHAGSGPLEGSIRGSGWYDPATDSARLDSFRVTLADLLALRGEGSVEELRTRRSFSGRLRLAAIDLGRVSRLLPERFRKDLAVTGEIAGGELEIAGAGGRVARLGGGLELRDCSVARGGELLARGVGGRFVLAREGNGYALRGRFSQPGQKEPVLRSLDLPLSARLTERLGLVRAEAERFSADISGLPVTGRLAYLPELARPFQLQANVPATPLDRLNQLLGKSGLIFSHGSAALSLTAEANRSGDLAGDAALGLARVRGEVRGKPVALGKGEMRARFSRTGKKPGAEGEFSLEGLEVDGRKGAARATWRLDDRTVILDRAQARFGEMTMNPGRVMARIGSPDMVDSGRSIPVQLEIAGAEGTSGELAARGVAAELRGRLRTLPDARWFEGEGRGSAGSVTFRGKPVASPTLRLHAARESIAAELGGTVLGGGLTGRAEMDPRRPEMGASGSVTLRKVGLAAAAPLLPAGAGITPDDGTLDISMDGRFTPKAGPSGRMSVRGEEISLSGKGGKRLVALAGVTLTAEVADERLTVREAVATLGEGVVVRGQGELRRFRFPDRQGEFSWSMASTDVNRIVDPVVNSLPRIVQEATLAGAVATEGRVTVAGKGILAEGSVDLAGISLDAPSQKLLVSGLDGRVPFSLAFGRSDSSRPAQGPSFTRENFPALRERLLGSSPEGSRVAIASARFGPLELGATNLRLQAKDGVTEAKIRSSLYGGRILGTGFVASGQGITYGSDLLVDDLSLRSLCSAIPAIKGYLSGRIDGILSLYGAGGGLQGLAGFTEFWARESEEEKMLLSREFLQKLAGKKLKGFFFRNDRPYDRAELAATLERGYLTFTTLDFSNTNLLGIRDLSVTVAPLQNRIALDHLLSAVKEAASRGTGTGTGGEGAGPGPATDFQWRE